MDTIELKRLPPGVIPPMPEPPEPPTKKRWFDGHSDGNFVRKLLVSMLLIATTVQPLSLLYTAYGVNLPTDWWSWTPALAVLLFIALDWTILPLAYHFATTNKPGLKIMLAIMLVVVAGGAFDGYFAATERFIAMRLTEITKHRLALEHAEGEVAILEQERDKMIKQQDSDRAHLDKQRDALNKKIATLDEQIATAQKTLDSALDNHLKLMNTIKEGCLKVNYVCLKPQQEAERARFEKQQAELRKQLEALAAEKKPLNDQLTALGTKEDVKVDGSNEEVRKAKAEAKARRMDFDVAVLDNQVYRWAGALHGESPRQVSAEQANRVLDLFAATVAIGYVVAQIMLSISFYGRSKKGLVESSKANWSLIGRSIRGYWARKRRGVYRDRKVVEFVPTSERTRVVYVPVNPGGPVPPAEEFVTKPLKAVANA
jgi:hypothetical protein